MKYIYTNVTQHIQTVLLASKTQDSVGVRAFTPGATLTLDYPGLNMYVPNILSCVIIDAHVDPVEEVKEEKPPVVDIKVTTVEKTDNEKKESQSVIVPPPVTTPKVEKPAAKPKAKAAKPTPKTTKK